jgi:hydroxymethylglutaryl-CoA lyase
MQGIKTFIPSEIKTDYINALLQVGFDVIDFGSFVSPKAVPQMRDTGQVISMLDMSDSDSKLLAIVPNKHGAYSAIMFDEITYLGFPFSISPTFLQKNIRSDLEQSFNTVQQILDICERSRKFLRVYISMAFGNPYGDAWNIDLLTEWVDKLHKAGVKEIALSDTVGLGTVENIGAGFATVVSAYPDIAFGLHLHTTSADWHEKIDAAYTHGCRSFDGVLSGLGGCPMAGPQLVGNIRTSDLLDYFRQNDIPVSINEDALSVALEKAMKTMEG